MNDVNDWKKLGLALGLREPTLEGLRGKQDAKMEMLNLWLNKVDGCNPSWDSLVKALREVDLVPIAEEIGKKYAVLRVDLYN